MELLSENKSETSKTLRVWLLVATESEKCHFYETESSSCPYSLSMLHSLCVQTLIQERGLHMTALTCPECERRLCEVTTTSLPPNLNPWHGIIGPNPHRDVLPKLQPVGDPCKSPGCAYGLSPDGKVVPLDVFGNEFPPSPDLSELFDPEKPS